MFTEFETYLHLVNNFFLRIVNMVFNMEFFDSVKFGRIALMVVVICLVFDLVLQVMGKRLGDAGNDIRANAPRSDLYRGQDDPMASQGWVTPYRR